MLNFGSREPRLPDWAPPIQLLAVRSTTSTSGINLRSRQLRNTGQTPSCIDSKCDAPFPRQTRDNSGFKGTVGNSTAPADNADLGGAST